MAGDFTEARHPAPWRVSLIAEALREYPGPQVFVRGNHDGERNGRSIVDVLGAMSGQWAGYGRPAVHDPPGLAPQRPPPNAPWQPGPQDRD